MFSARSKYAIRAMSYLARQEKGTYVQIREISRELNLSFHFLTKIFQDLSAKKFITSSKGAKGGVKLVKDLKKISLYDIFVTIEGKEIFEICSLGLKTCNNKKPCPIHHEWSKIRDKLKTVLTNADLDNVVEELQKNKIHLTD